MAVMGYSIPLGFSWGGGFQTTSNISLEIVWT